MTNHLPFLCRIFGHYYKAAYSERLTAGASIYTYHGHVCVRCGNVANAQPAQSA